MRFFFPFTPLRDRADDNEGSNRIDPGAPHFHTTDPDPKPAAKAAEKSDVEKRLEALEADLVKKDARIAELAESERYWANRNREQPKPADDEDPDEANHLPIRRADDDTPGKLLDDMSKDGRVALEKRGFITREEMLAEIKRVQNESRSELTAAQEGAAFDQKLGKEFPELSDPKSELFKKAQVHFREMVEVDPRAKNSRSALWASAKMAKKEIESEAATKNNQTRDRDEAESRRRDRIDRQRGERDTGGGDGDEKNLTPIQREIIGRLSVSEEQFNKYAESGRNGRGR